MTSRLNKNKKDISSLFMNETCPMLCLTTVGTENTMSLCVQKCTEPDIKWTDPFLNCKIIQWDIVQFSHSVMSLWDPMYCKMSGFPVHHQLLLKLMFIELMMPYGHMGNGMPNEQWNMNHTLSLGQCEGQSSLTNNTGETTPATTLPYLMILGKSSHCSKI